MALFGGNPVQDFEKLKKLAADARQPFDKDFLLNIAFFLGEQYSVWNPDQAAVMTAPRPAGLENAPRPIVNKITSFVMKQRASVLESKPNIDVMPATDDPEDISMSAVMLAYLKWWMEPSVADYNSELSEAVLWALAGGEGYLKWTWNDAEGRPDLMACSGTEIYGDPYARKFKSGRYAIHEQYLDVHQVENTYNKKVQPTTRSRTDLMKAAVLRDMGVAPVLEGCVVNELWLRPNMDKRWPDGRMCVWTGNQMLYDIDHYPYKHGKLPFTQVGSIPRPGSAHYTCSVKNLRAPQMELNKYHAQRITVREMFSNPKWWIPNELDLESDPDNSPNQILRGNSSGGQYTPSIIQPTTFPENSDGEWLVQEMNDAAGQHETSRGQVPGRVEAARAIEMLKQHDDSALSELSQTVNTSAADGGYMVLMLLKQYGKDEQIVQTYSREGFPEVHRFLTSKINPACSVRILSSSGLATTRAARQDQTLLYWQNQIITDPQVAAELLELPVGRTDPQGIFDIRLARNENLIMAEDNEAKIKERLGKNELTGHEKYGIALTPNSWDNHDVHIREHNNYRKTAEFDTLTIGAQQKFEFHVQMHKDLRMKEMKEQMEEQALATGVGAAPPATTSNGTSGPAPVEDQEPTAEDEAQVMA